MAREPDTRRVSEDIDDLRRRLDALSLRPMEVDNIRFPPRVVLAIIAVILTMVGGMYAATYGLRSDVRDILTKMESQKELADVNQRLTDERSAILRNAIDTMDKRQQLQAIEIQNLKEMILRQGAKP